MGLDVGARIQAPTRVAPFVGAGASAGILFHEALSLALNAAGDSFDDSALLMDESNDEVDGFAAFYPEVGTHFWVDGRIRLTAYGRYLITTEGRGFDDWLVGGQVTMFAR